MKRLESVFEKSRDGKDQNLLILLHGLGDTASNFIKFGRKLELPQTALLAIQAPYDVPFFEGKSWWSQPFDLNTGDTRQPTGKELVEMRQVLLGFIEDECIQNRKFQADQVFVLGFSQGGSMAMDIAMHSKHEFRGIISISGIALQESIPTLPIQKHPFLMTHGTQDDTFEMAKQQASCIDGPLILG